MVNLSGFFESGKIVHQYRFEYCAPKGGLQKEVLRSREHTTNIPNLYVVAITPTEADWKQVLVLERK
jgi:hypothetical protein